MRQEECYYEIDESKYRISLKSVKLEDCVGVCYSRDELKELGVGSGIKRDKIKNDLNEYVKVLKEGKKKSVEVDDDLLEVFKEYGYYLNDFSDVKLSRVGNKIKLKKIVDKKKLKPTKSDFSSLMELFVSKMRKDGIYVNVKITFCKDSIKCINLMKKMYSWEELENYGKERNWNLSSGMVEKLYKENDVDLSWGKKKQYQFEIVV